MCSQLLFKEALDYYSKVDYSILPLNILYHFHHNIGVCHAKLKNYDIALIHLTEALIVFPDKMATKENYAIILMLQNKYEIAVHHLNLV